MLQPGDFYRERNQLCFAAAMALFQRDQAIDQLTLAGELARTEKLDAVGGMAYLSHLVSITPTSAHSEEYAEIVSRTSTMRKLIDAAAQISALGYNDTDDLEATLRQAEDTLFAVRGAGQNRGFIPLRQIYDQYLQDRAGAVEPLLDMAGPVMSGYADLDELLGGIQRSDMVILGARPSLGKSTLALNICLNAARNGSTAGIFSLEMSREQLGMRILSSEAEVDSHRLRLDLTTFAEQQRIIDAIGQLSDLPVYIDDTPNQGMVEMRSKARRLSLERGLDLLVVDYLQLVEGPRRGYGANRVQEISEISRSLKSLARDLGIALIACSQLSRLVENRPSHRPLLSDLRDSGCLSGDTLITLADSGERVPIQELVGTSGFNVWALNQDTYRVERSTVSNVFSTGVKPVFEMTTRLGRRIRATANHRFLTINGWRRLDELAPGERIALPRTLRSPRKQDMGSAELGLLGHLIGDGCTLAGHAVQYTTRERDLARMVADFSKEMFGDTVNPRICEERQWYQVYLASTRHHTHGVRSAVVEWLDSLGVFDLRSHEKYVPERVFQQCSEGIALFLRHIWATDGCIRMRGGISPYPAIYYASSSERLGLDVQSLLLRIGINARLKRVAQGDKGRDQFHVIVSGKDDILTFASSVGAVGRYKTEALDSVRTFVAHRKANTNRDLIPAIVWLQNVKPAMVGAGVTHRELYAKLGMPYADNALFNYNMSRERAQQVAEILSSETLQSLAASDVYWDEVQSIEPDGVREVFDMTVPDLHNFVANDIIVHNSIEQDADVVMFIHREDVYTSEEEWEQQRPGQPYPKNIADIIVAKHRNGPTGNIQLEFRDNLVRFDSFARVPEY